MATQDSPSPKSGHGSPAKTLAGSELAGILDAIRRPFVRIDAHASISVAGTRRSGPASSGSILFRAWITALNEERARETLFTEGAPEALR